MRAVAALAAASARRRESLESGFYREKVRSLRGRTHGDLSAQSMRRHRKRL